MDTIVAIDLNGKELPKQIKQFVQDINWMRDEGFVEFEEVQGVIRIFPVHGKLRPGA